MDNQELRKSIAAKYGGASNATTKKVINRAIRTLPGGPELLDAIMAANAARNHAARNNATDRIVATDAAIDRLEQIRDAMERHVIESVGGASE